VFIEARDNGSEVTTGAISRAKLQSNRHNQQNNTQFFTGRMPFLSPNQQCQGTEGKQGIITLIVKNISWHLKRPVV